MRMTQYVFVLVLQFVLLGAMLAFGAELLITPASDQPETPGVSQTEPAQDGGISTLRDYMSR